MAQPIVAALLQDALAEFGRAIAHIPEPGRHRRLGRLNDPAWSVAHLTSSLDAWVNHYARGRDVSPWLNDWFERQRALPSGEALHTDLDEACAAFEEFVASVTPFLEACDEATLSAQAERLHGPWTGRSAGYLVARSAAHAFVHAGELTVIAALAGAGDLDLPALPKARAAAEAPQTPEELRRTVALALDARHELERVALALPRAVRGPTFGPRLKAGANILAHAAQAEDRVWNRQAQGLEPDPWLVPLDLDAIQPGDPEPLLDFHEALDAYRRICDRSHAHIKSHRQGGATIERLPWTAAHLFSHAGELAAIGSLAGMADLGLPGETPHSADGPGDR